MAMTTTTPSDGSAASHVAFFAFPFSTHAAPLLHITRHLAASAPTTLFSFFNTTKSSSSIFSVSREGETNDTNIRRCDVWDGVPEGYVFKGKPQEDIELFMTSAPEAFRKAVAVTEAETGRRVSCMVSDGFLWFVGQMAEEAAVPWVVFWTSGEHSLYIHINTDLIRERIGIEGADSRRNQVLTFIPGISNIRVQDLPDGVILGNLESIFSKMLHQMGRVLHRADLVFTNSFQELDPVVTVELNSKLGRFISVGPVNLLTQQKQLKDSSDSCLRWLDEQETGSVAYVGFGSVVRPSKDEIIALGEALEESRVKFLWSLREDLKAFLPEGYVERNKGKGMVLPWVPQVKVLEHRAVGVSIIHFGWNSVLECMAAQVPMIGRPFLGDQKLNGQLVEAVWEIGVQVEGGVFTRDGVRKCLELVLHGDKGKKFKKNIVRLGKLAQEAVRPPKGSSLVNFTTLLEIVTKR
ncbi:hypothetical protein Nepgr_020305 [Nepenthes gracilis]|uniref:2-hydroxyflavanone C-glucosyltransferase n=1 Tax=Nepenthes gracilis TaxID=150966 RepID=A0AAD3XVX7_NEPGR|nr:hypothetical protein Nepgr_020305 [Nepenthes gracilis]